MGLCDSVTLQSVSEHGRAISAIESAVDVECATDPTGPASSLAEQQCHGPKFRQTSSDIIARSRGRVNVTAIASAGIRGPLAGDR
jgi:hypothetical protein